MSQPAHRRIATPEGLTLAVDRHGPGHGPAVVLLHGGGQTRHAWRETAAMLGRLGYVVHSMDLRGHGDSDWSAEGRYALASFRDDLVEVMETVEGPAVLIGASLGGLVAMLAAGETLGERVSGLVLVDITPAPSEDRSQGIRAFMAADPGGFASLEEAADAVARYLPHRPRPKDNAGLMKNLRWRDGRLHWHWDPGFMAIASSGRLGERERLAAATRAFAGPILLVRGDASELVAPSDVDDFKALSPKAEVVTVPDARHMVAGDQNTVFGEAVVSFLQRTAPVEG